MRLSARFHFVGESRICRARFTISISVSLTGGLASESPGANLFICGHLQAAGNVSQCGHASALRGLQNPRDRRHLPAPFSRLAAEPLSPSFGKSAVFCSPTVLRLLPLCLDQSSPVEPLNSEKQPACVEANNALAHLFDSNGNAVPVHSSAKVFRISISSVPWTRSLGLSGTRGFFPSCPWHPGGAYPCPYGCQRGESSRLARLRQARTLAGSGTAAEALGRYLTKITSFCASL
jgi:hypothetical protein